MTRDDIIRMAKQAAEETGTLVPTEWNDPLLERFAALVAAEIRARGGLRNRMHNVSIHNTFSKQIGG